MKRKIIYTLLTIMILAISLSLSNIYFNKKVQKENKKTISENIVENNTNIANNEKKTTTIPTTTITAPTIPNDNLSGLSTMIKNFIKDNPNINENETFDPNENFTIKLSFAGDTIIASSKDKTSSGNFNDYANKKEATYFLEKVSHILKADDFTILNLENVLSDQPLKEIGKNYSPAYWFKSKTANINILSSSSIEGVSISNNHIGDYGDTGKKDTINTILNANIQYGNADQIMYFKKNNFIVAVICRGLWAESQANGIINAIKKASKNSDYQIVFFHGGTEKIHQPEAWKQRAARKIIDNGAELVLGSHPHVLQPREIYKGKEIVYSLGNFAYGANRAPENRTIIYQMTLNIDPSTKTVLTEESNIIPCYVYTGSSNNYQPSPIKDEAKKNKVLDFMNGKINSPL